MKRKVVALFLVFSLLMTLTTPAFASETNSKLSMEQALAIAKKLIDLPAAASKNMDVQYYEGENGWEQGPTWNFNWNVEDPGMWQWYAVAIDANTGSLRNLNQDDGVWRTPDKYKNVKPISREDAQALAEGFLKEHAAEYFAKARFVEGNDEQMYFEKGASYSRYNFRYEKVINGVSTDEGLTIVVDPYSRKIVNYWSNWFEEQNYPSAEGAISVEDVKKLFEEQVGMRLVYHRQETWLNLNQSPKLVYLPNISFNGGIYIDATKGEFFTPWGDQKIEPLKPEDLKPLITGDVTPKTRPEKPLTMDEALTLAKSFVSIPEGFELRSRRYNETWRMNGTKTWSFDWSPQNHSGSINVSVDVVSGEIASFHSWDNKEMPSTSKANYTWEQGKEIAAEFLKKANPQKAKELTFNPDNLKPIFREGDSFYPRYHYSLIRLVNGVPYLGSNVNVDVDAMTGKVVSYWSNWDSHKFESAEEVISKEDALAAYMKGVDFALRYIRVNKPETPNQPEYVLAYVAGNNVPQAIDAKTGEVVDLYNHKLMESVTKSVGSHWARDSVVALASAGVVQGDGKDLKLNDNISRAEFAKLLVSIAGVELVKSDKATFSDVAKDKWYYDYIETAAKEELISGNEGKFRPNDPVTRQEMAVMIDRLISKGQEKVDSTSIKGKFKDAEKVAPWAKGAFDKLTTLGVLAGDTKKNLRPTSKLTRAEAMNVIFKVASQNRDGMLMAKAMPTAGKG